MSRGRGRVCARSFEVFGGRCRSCVSGNGIGGAGAAVADTVLRSLKLNFVLRVMDGIRAFGSPPLKAELACHYRVPHVRCIVRTRVMCQAGRARATSWRAPLWVVHVCALLREGVGRR